MLYKFIKFSDRTSVKIISFLLLALYFIITYSDWTLHNPYGWDYPKGFHPYQWLYIEIPLMIPGFLFLQIRSIFRKEAFETKD